MKKILCVSLCLIFCLAVLASCGGGIEGSYKVKSVMGMDLEALASTLGQDVSEVEKMFSMELKSDGKGTITSQGETIDLTWKQNGNDLTITINGEDGKATVNGNEITISEDGVEMVFVKK